MGIFRRSLGTLLGIDTTARDVWGHSSSRTFPQAAETIRIASGGNAADTAAGNGAREVMVEILDENWQSQIVTLATAGASASAASVLTAIRVQRAWVSASGVYGAANTGAITIENVTSGTVLAVIPAGEGVANQSHFTVPASHIATPRGFLVTIGGAAGSARMWARQNADDITAPFPSPSILARVEGLISNTRCEAVGIPTQPPKTDIWWTGVASTGTTNVTVDTILELNAI